MIQLSRFPMGIDEFIQIPSLAVNTIRLRIPDNPKFRHLHHIKYRQGAITVERMRGKHANKNSGE